MTYRPVTRWSLRDGSGQDVYGDFGQTWEWRFTRGTEPYMVTITAADDRFSALQNPVELRFETPNVSGDIGTVLRVRNLYILSATANEATGGYSYLLADVRWMLAYAKVEAQHNIVSYGGELRPQSAADADQERWTRWGAVQDVTAQVVQRLNEEATNGLRVFPGEVFLRKNATGSSGIDDALPDNLGNAPNGGWVGAPWAQVVQTYLGDHADITVRADGTLEVVDRDTLAMPATLAYARFRGQVATRDVRWQRPRKVRVHFRKRYGGIFKFVDPDGTVGQSTVPNPDRIEPEVQNVLPAAGNGVSGVLLGLPDDSIDWHTLAEWLVRFEAVTGEALSTTDIRRKFLAPSMVDTSDMEAPTRLATQSMIATLRRGWRRWWRVRDDNVRRNLAGLELGYLAPDGTTQPAPVRCPYALLWRMQWDRDAPLSGNFDTDSSLPPPFSAQWIDREGLVFALVANDQGLAVDTVYPGHFVDDVRIPDLQDIVDDDHEVQTEAVARFKAAFEMQVRWTGDWVGELRTHYVDVDVFPESEVPLVETMSVGTPACFRQDEPDGEYAFVNVEEVEARARLIAGEIAATYRQPRGGVVDCVGVAVLTEGNGRVRGEVQEIAVVVGETHPHQIHTRIVIAPQRRTRMREADPVPPAEPARML